MSVQRDKFLKVILKPMDFQNFNIILIQIRYTNYLAVLFYEKLLQRIIKSKYLCKEYKD